MVRCIHSNVIFHSFMNKKEWDAVDHYETPNDKERNPTRQSSKEKNTEQKDE